MCPKRILTKILFLNIIDSSRFAVHPVDCVKLLCKCCQPSTGEWDFFLKKQKRNILSSIEFHCFFVEGYLGATLVSSCAHLEFSADAVKFRVAGWGSPGAVFRFPHRWVKAWLWLGHSRTNAQMLIGTLDSVSVPFAPLPQHDAAITVLHHRDQIGQMMRSVWFPLNRKFRFEDKMINCGFLWPETLVCQSLSVQGVLFSF